jgi:hypothetical protein
MVNPLQQVTRYLSTCSACVLGSPKVGQEVVNAAVVCAFLLTALAGQEVATPRLCAPSSSCRLPPRRVRLPPHIGHHTHDASPTRALSIPPPHPPATFVHPSSSPWLLGKMTSTRATSRWTRRLQTASHWQAFTLLITFSPTRHPFASTRRKPSNSSSP